MKFELSKYVNFDCEELCLRSSNKDIVYTLYPSDKEKSLKDSSEFIIKGVGSSTEEEAREEGMKVKNALMWFGINNRLGVNFIKSTGKSSNFLKKELFDKFGVTVLDDNGLNIYPENDESTVFISFSGEGYGIHKPLKPFAETFQNGLNIELNKKKKLSLELYNASHFESSIRAKFLTLIIAIESLISPIKKSDEAVKFIESLIEQTGQQAREDIKSLVDRLGDLKIESISSSAKSLVKKHLEYKQYDGNSAEGFFKKCYDIRKKLVHDGDLPEGIGDLSKITINLDKMVSDLLISCVEMN